MSDFRYTTEIRVSPARVWSVLLDVERWPEWTTSVTRIQRMEVGPITLGSRTRIWQPKLMPAVWCVTSLDSQRHIFTWATSTLGVKVTARHQLEPVGAHSRLILTLHYSGILGLVMARMMRSLNWDYLAREGDGLRHRCEAVPPSQFSTPKSIALPS
jgi:uncharacterized protein YndB with AHSA1/START domain